MLFDCVRFHSILFTSKNCVRVRQKPQMNLQITFSLFISFEIEYLCIVCIFRCVKMFYCRIWISMMLSYLKIWALTPFQLLVPSTDSHCQKLNTTLNVNICTYACADSNDRCKGQTSEKNV